MGASFAVMRNLSAIIFGALGAIIVIAVAAFLDLPIVLKVSAVRDGMAAWVQAIGALIALAVVFVAQRLDHRETRSQRDADRRERREGYARTSVTTAKYLVASIAALENTQASLAVNAWPTSLLQLLKADLGSAIASLKVIDRGQLPSEEAVIASINLMQAGYTAEVHIAAIEKALADGLVPVHPPFNSVREGAETSLKKLIECWMKEIGSG